MAGRRRLERLEIWEDGVLVCSVLMERVSRVASKTFASVDVWLIRRVKQQRLLKLLGWEFRQLELRFALELDTSTSTLALHPPLQQGLLQA